MHYITGGRGNFLTQEGGGALHTVTLVLVGKEKELPSSSPLDPSLLPFPSFPFPSLCRYITLI